MVSNNQKYHRNDDFGTHYDRNRVPKSRNCGQDDDQDHPINNYGTHYDRNCSQTDDFGTHYDQNMVLKSCNHVQDNYFDTH